MTNAFNLFPSSKPRFPTTLLSIPQWATEPKVSWTITLTSCLLIYLSLVRLLRFRALHKMQAENASYLAAPYTMSYKTAHSILKLALLNDFPFTHVFSTQWALVKTYGIASGTPLLSQTGRLTKPTQVAKRAEDTSVIITEFLAGDQDSERGRRALAKMNWLHARYGAKIARGEMIYTMSVFVLEPIRWIKMYEWREMTELECVALFVYWKEIGNRMGIPDIPDTLEKLEAWVAEFEKKEMVYADTNRLCAEATIGLLLRDVPSPLKGVARKMALAFMEEKVRKAVGSEEPPFWAEGLVTLIFRVRAWMIRNLFLPRLRRLDPLPRPGKDGRLRREPGYFLFEPWYVKDTIWSRWTVWLNSRGRLSPGPKYTSEGYLPEELGPAEYKRASKDAVLKEADEIKLYAEKGGAVGLGCPFSFGN